MSGAATQQALLEDLARLDLGAAVHAAEGSVSPRMRWRAFRNSAPHDLLVPLLVAHQQASARADQCAAEVVKTLNDHGFTVRV